MEKAPHPALRADLSPPKGGVKRGAAPPLPWRRGRIAPAIRVRGPCGLRRYLKLADLVARRPGIGPGVVIVMGDGVADGQRAPTPISINVIF